MLRSISYLIIFLISFSCGKSRIQFQKSKTDKCQNTNFHQNLLSVSNLSDMFQCLNLDHKYPKTSMYLQLNKENQLHILNKINSKISKNHQDSKKFIKFLSEISSNQILDKNSRFIEKNLNNDSLNFSESLILNHGSHLKNIGQNLEKISIHHQQSLNIVENKLFKQIIKNKNQVQFNNENLIRIMDSISEKEDIDQIINFVIQLTRDNKFSLWLKSLDKKRLQGILETPYIKNPKLQKDIKSFWRIPLDCHIQDKILKTDLTEEVKRKTEYFLSHDFSFHFDSMMDLYFKKEVFLKGCNETTEKEDAINNTFEIVTNYLNSEDVFKLFKIIVPSMANHLQIWDFFASETNAQITELLINDPRKIELLINILTLIKEDVLTLEFANKIFTSLQKSNLSGELIDLWKKLSLEEKNHLINLVESNFDDDGLSVVQSYLLINSRIPSSRNLISFILKNHEQLDLINFLEDLKVNKDELTELFKSGDIKKIVQLLEHNEKLVADQKFNNNNNEKNKKINYVESRNIKYEQCFINLKNTNKNKTSIWEYFEGVKNVCSIEETDFVVNRLMYEVILFQNDFYEKFMDVNPLVTPEIIVESFWFFIANKNIDEKFYDNLYSLLNTVAHHINVVKVLPTQIKLDSIQLNQYLKSALSITADVSHVDFQECHKYFLNKFGEDPCKNKNEVFNSIMLIRELLLKDHQTENALRLLSHWLTSGIDIPRGKNTRKHILTIEEFIHFIVDLSRPELNQTIYYHENGKIKPANANVLERLEVVIRDIGFINNFYGAFFENKVSKADEYQPTLISLKKQLKMMVGSSGLFRGIDIYPQETKYLLKNVFNTYDSLIEVDDEYVSFDGKTRRYGDLVQAILTLLVRSSSASTIDFNPYQRPKEEIVEGHNGLILRELMRLSLFRHLSTYINEISQQNPIEIFKDGKIKLISDHLFKQITSENLEYLLNRLLKSKNFPLIIEDILEMNSIKKQKILKMLYCFSELIVKNNIQIDSKLIEVILKIIDDYHLIRNMKIESINIDHLINLIQHLIKNDYQDLAVHIPEIIKGLKISEFNERVYQSVFQVLDEAAKFTSIHHYTLLEYAGINESLFENLLNKTLNFLNAENRSEIIDHWLNNGTEKNQIELFLFNFMGKNKIEILNYVEDSQNYIQAI